MPFSDRAFRTTFCESASSQIGILSTVPCATPILSTRSLLYAAGRRRVINIVGAARTMTFSDRASPRGLKLEFSSAFCVGASNIIKRLPPRTSHKSFKLSHNHVSKIQRLDPDKMETHMYIIFLGPGLWAIDGEQSQNFTFWPMMQGMPLHRELSQRSKRVKLM